MLKDAESIKIINAQGSIDTSNPFQAQIGNGTNQADVNISKQLLTNAELNVEGTDVSVQNPLPVDGDSIYNKDIDFNLSTIGTFSGDLTSIFGDYEAEITDATAANPKTFTLRFKRPVTSNKIGIGSKTGNFSNVKILLKDLSGTVRETIDDSTNDTKYTSNIYSFTNNTFIEMVVEFHTTDEVKISGMFIPKAQARSISGIDGIISLKNTTMTPLGSGASFVGESETTTNYGAVAINLYTDQAGTFLIEGRLFGSSTWREVETYVVEAGQFKQWSFQGTPTMIRASFTCGATPQTVFEMETILKPVYVKPSSHPIGGTIKGNDDAELTKSQITGERPDGDYGNVAVTNGNNLKISLEEYDPTFLANPLPVRDPQLTIARSLVTGMMSVNKFGRNIEIDSAAIADIWDGGHTVASGGVSLIWVAPTQARIHAIVSTSLNDSDTGGVNPQSDGARTVRVFGLTDWDTAEVSEDIILDGTTSVNTSNSYVIIHRIRVLTKGNNATGPNVGVITATAATDATITAQIRAGQGQTQMAIYGIPSTQKAYIGRLYANANKAGGAAGLLDVSLLSNPEPQTEITSFLTKHTFGLQSTGTSALTIPYYSPKVIEGPAIIKVQASSNTNDMDVSAGFDLVVIDN